MLKRPLILLQVFIAIVLLSSFYKDISKQADLNIAVASNFKHTAQILASEFEKESGYKLSLSSASTGVLYSQIKNAAPFDVFLSADAERPELLIAEGLADAKSEIVYAKGKVAVWGAGNKNKFPNWSKDCLQNIKENSFDKIIIANPKIAPYGKASEEALQNLGLFEANKNKLVFANNISQSFSTTRTANVDMGFIAMSHYIRKVHGKEKANECVWIPPVDSYKPIDQKAVILNRDVSKKQIAEEFLNFLQKPETIDIIKHAGYDV